MTVADAIVVVQARAGSTRLPGKVLMDVGGRPMLRLMLDRLVPLRQASVDLVVATSTLDRDDPVALVAAEAGAHVVRGDEADVLLRFAQAVEAHPADTVVRLTADCPLIDPALVVEALRLHRATGADYTSNTLVRTYPDGLDVEVLRADSLRAAAADATDPAEREHVTPFVYRRPRRFAIAQLVGHPDLGEERWTVDTADDIARVRAAVEAVGDLAAAPWTALRSAFDADAVPEGMRAVVTSSPPHRPGGPFQRRWDLIDGAATIGSATVTVDAGHGVLDLEMVDPTQRDDAIAAVRRRLGADLQVVDLAVDEAY